MVHLGDQVHECRFTIPEFLFNLSEPIVLRKDFFDSQTCCNKLHYPLLIRAQPSLVSDSLIFAGTNARSDFWHPFLL